MNRMTLRGTSRLPSINVMIELIYFRLLTYARWSWGDDSPAPSIAACMFTALLYLGSLCLLAILHIAGIGWHVLAVALAVVPRTVAIFAGLVIGMIPVAYFAWSGRYKVIESRVESLPEGAYQLVDRGILGFVGFALATVFLAAWSGE